MTEELRLKPLLITGLPGVPGWNLFHWFQKRWPGLVVGIRPPDNQKANVPGSVGIDARDGHLLVDLFEKHQFGAVIDASGNCALKACECDPALSDLLNCQFGVHVAKLAQEYGSRLVRLSSDLVYSGDDSHTAPYREEEEPDPVTEYGKSMMKAEVLIGEIKPDCHILRIPLPMGLTPGGHAGAIDWIEWRFRNGRPATLYFDEKRSPIHKDDLAKVVEWILLEGPIPPGIYHCGGPRDVSLYQIAQIINAVGGYDPGLLGGCMRIEAGPLPPRAGDVTISSQKLLQYIPAGLIRPWPMDSRLVPDGVQWHRLVDRSTWGGGHQIHPLLIDGKYIE
jgi:dTDP-4-dehydrorhamnose reductase